MNQISDYINNHFTNEVFIDFEALAKTIRVHNIEDCYSSFNTLKDKARQFLYYEPDYIKHIFYTAVINIYEQSISTILDDADDTHFPYVWQRISSTSSFTEMFDICVDIAQKFISAIGAQSANKSTNLLDIIKDFINTHYMENITLDSVAQTVYISPRHLRRIFSQNNNLSFRSYLMQVRMENAKQLLLENKYKIYEVAQMVGYKNIKAFRECFTEYFGVTPSKISGGE